jgi:hypothetical protein
MSDGNGNGDGVQVEVISGALVRRDRPQEQTEIERRRKHVLHFRFVLRLTESEIVKRIARLDPPIITTRTTISRDVQALRSTFRRQFSQRNFDPRAEVGIIVAGIEHVIAKSFRDARRTPDHKERALHRRIALDAFERLSALYQALGLVQRRDFAVPDDDGKAVGRIPSGTELQQLFRDVQVDDGEITSAAETAFRHGDWAAATDAPE